MKLHLPIALLAVFASSVAYATMRPEIIVNVAENKTVEVEADYITQKQSQYVNEDSDYRVIGTFTKDGQGTLTISASYKLSQTLNVREGEVRIGNGKEGERVEILAQPYLADSPMISIGGNNASLVLDNASYRYNVHDAGGRTSYVSGVAIGNLDGTGSLTLKGGSELYTSQSYFAYARGSYAHVQGSYASVLQKSGDDAISGQSDVNTDQNVTYTFGTQDVKDDGYSGDALYNGGTRTNRSQLNILDGSKVQAGMTFYFADIDIKVDGAGSVFEDGVRAIDRYSGWLGDDDGSGATDVVTNVTISGGGTWTSRHDLTTGCATKAVTNVTVTGEGSTFNSLRTTYLGDDGAGSTTNLTIVEGAVANITDMIVAQASGTEKATVKIADKGSSMNVGKLTVNQGGKVDNSGTITLSDKEKVLTWRDDSSMGLPPGNYKTDVEQVECGISVSGGELVNSGIITSTDAGSMLEIIGGGSVVNSGEIGLTTQVDGGALTLNGGSMAAVKLIDGDIYVNGATTTGALTLTGGTITFNLDAQVATYARNATPATMLTVDSLDVTGTKIVVNLSDEAFNKLDGSTFNLFDVEGEEGADLSGADIVFTNGTQSKVGTVTANEDGSFTVKDTKLVPEPTTATLSLLALAALAARRRRK
ncbi:MAG: PEP-CTERM sorting domain-containing protein [Akkermansia sp.]|nr:PEP-CTERM sorting domain-containing protein [Akkermansia sp.]